MRVPMPVVFGLVLFPVVASTEAYLCAADHSTGFHFNQQTRSWKAARFKVEGKKYLLSQKDGA